MSDQQAAAAGEIAMALPRLIRLAELNDLQLLAFLLEQARAEADREAKQPGQPTTNE